MVLLPTPEISSRSFILSGLSDSKSIIPFCADQLLSDYI